MNAEGDPGRLHGRTVLVVRAGSAFGRAAVERFAAEGARVHAHNGQIADGDERRTAVGAAVGATVGANGGLDVLVVPPPVASSRPFPAAGAEDHRAAVDAGLRATFFLVQEAVRSMPHGGRICVAAPVRLPPLSSQMPAPATLVEGGLVALVRLLAVELAPRLIAVNALCPIGARADAVAVASGLAFLASDDASYLSGAFIPVVEGATSDGRRPSESRWGALSNAKE